MIYLISDLHLTASDEALHQRFANFCSRMSDGDSLYILGDLFEYWLGDDAIEFLDHTEAKARLAELSDRGVGLSFLAGNRDFLIGDGFCAASGCRLLPDPTVIDLYDTPTLLMHGDLLCTDDATYQAMRGQIRSPAFVDQFLARPIPERKAIAAEYRRRSGEAISLKAEDIMDANQLAVEERMRRHGVNRLIHGHTHRPGVHRFDLDGRRAERWVLPEWKGDRIEVLRADASGLRMEPFGA